MVISARTEGQRARKLEVEEVEKNPVLFVLFDYYNFFLLFARFFFNVSYHLLLFMLLRRGERRSWVRVGAISMIMILSCYDSIKSTGLPNSKERRKRRNET